MARGLAVEPIKRYLEEMLDSSADSISLGGLPAVTGLQVAVDADDNVHDLDANVPRGEKTVPMFFLSANDVRHWVVDFGGSAAKRESTLNLESMASPGSDLEMEAFLPPDIFGCNSLGAPHPLVMLIS